MKKTLLLVCLASIITSFSAKAECLSLYQDQDFKPDRDAILTGSLMSTTGVAIAYIGVEAGLLTTGAAVTAMQESDSVIIDLIALDMINDAISSASHAVAYGSSSTLEATGIIEGAENDFGDEIRLIQEAMEAPNKIGSTLLEVTEDINETRSLDRAHISVDEVAREIRQANDSDLFCQDERSLMNYSDMVRLVRNRLE